MAFFRHFLTYGSWRKDAAVLIAVILLSYALFGHIQPHGITATPETEEYTVWDHLADSVPIATEIGRLARTEHLESLNPEELEQVRERIAHLRQQMEINEKRRQATRVAEEAAVRDWFLNFDAAD